MATLNVPVRTLLRHVAKNLETDSPSLIVKLPGGRDVQYSLVGQQIVREVLSNPVDMDGLHRLTRFDFRAVKPRYKLPVTVPYSNMGFWGALSGSKGTITINKDGSISRSVEVVS